MRLVPFAASRFFGDPHHNPFERAFANPSAESDGPMERSGED